MFSSQRSQDAYIHRDPDPTTGRRHRARSTVLSSSDLVEIRAAQRTFEGAYMRTSLSQFSFALVVLKIFTREFYSIGALFAVYGAGVLAVAILRRREGNKQFFIVMGGTGDRDGEREGEEREEEVHRAEGLQGLVHEKRFRTSGNVVVVLTVLSVMAYATLLVLTLRLGDTD